ncbi:hypothetical protein MBLNU459_g4557t2 [Dothideomycetes sp. NU459]
MSQTVSENWQGRIWGRTNCTFNNQGTANGGGKACGTGDCNGALSCSVTGDTPVTLAEFTLDGGDGQTYYDISLVDGYNLPLGVALIAHGNSSLADIPPNLTNPACTATIGELAGSNYNPYNGGQTILGTNGSYPLPWDTSVSSSTVSSWCPWDLQVNPPTAPGDGVYPYPDSNIARPAFNPCYSACAKYNEDAYCCTGSHDTSSTCQPNYYSKVAKSVCPDAYSYAYDDQTSTFIIPSGAGFEVVFCPTGRSTNILATSAQKLHQLASSGTVTGSSGSTATAKSLATPNLEIRGWGIALVMLVVVVEILYAS